MKLTWLGHSCFLLESADGSCVFDPYAPGSVPGLELGKLAADMCLCSHGHGDHAYSDAVSLTGNDCALKVTAADTFHDGVRGTLRGKNIVYTVAAEGMRVTHMGDIGHIPDAETLEKIGKPDVLMIPVGGFFTVDAAKALEIVRRIAPRIVIPMHYRGDGFGYGVLSTADAFIAGSENVVRLDTNELTVTPDTPRMTAILTK